MARRSAIIMSILAACLLFACCGFAWGQAITISTKPSLDQPIDRRYQQIEPTNVALPAMEIDARGHQEILRTLVAEQGFAMRPLPKGKKGLTLVANGKLSPVGEAYISMVTEQGLSVKPGDRVVLSDIRIDRDKLVFDINGGPERKHEFLRHIQIGMGGGGGMTQPVVQDPGQDPIGARITLTFAGHVPDLTPTAIKALLAPLISFDVKTPVQAYTDTLPPKLKEAILGHHVMVGMTTDMVIFALGQPEAKSREMDGQMPFEEWIYGHPPQDVNFVRVNGNRVIRVEVAKLGQPLEVFTTDEVEGLMMSNGRPVVAQATPHDEHTVKLGDVHRDPDTQAPLAPPSLRNPGEKLPGDDPNRTITGSREGPMRPVIFPKDTSNSGAQTPDVPPNGSQTPAKPDASGKGGEGGGLPSPQPSAQPPAQPSLPSPASDEPKQMFPAKSGVD